MRRSSLMPRFEVLHDLVAVELGWTPLIRMRALPVMGCSEAAAGKLKAFTDWPCLQASRDGTSRRSFAAILSELLTKGLFFLTHRTGTKYESTEPHQARNDSSTITHPVDGKPQLV